MTSLYSSDAISNSLIGIDHAGVVRPAEDKQEEPLPEFDWDIEEPAVDLEEPKVETLDEPIVVEDPVVEPVVEAELEQEQQVNSNDVNDPQQTRPDDLVQDAQARSSFVTLALRLIL